VDFVQLEGDPRLRRPRVVAAFRGWNDAGGGGSLAAGYLRSVTDAERFAVIDSEPFVDYQQTRPTVSMVDGDVRHVEWPVTEVFASQDHDLMIVLGTEPNMRWRAFSDSIVDLAQRYGSRLVITMGALLADTPHTRPVPVSASASDPDLMSRHGLVRSTYEGPTGIVGVLHDSCSRAGLVSASLWAATPHYISAAPNPQAALALLERLADLAGTPAGSAELERAASEYQLRVASAIADDPDVAGYVEQLEQAADRDDPPTGEELAADFERYLREQSDEKDD
jgi:predicted ATP-grasp superfamily ATP-dependent carboligase